MILVIGGAFQGKRNFVLNKLMLDEKNVLFDFHICIKNILKNGGDVEKYFSDILIDPNIRAVVSDEIGCGIVPIDKDERIWREITGRKLCELALNSESVYRVSCGIALKIK